MASKKNMENIFRILGDVPSNCTNAQGDGCPTILLAAAQKANTLNYGRFLQAIINFFIISIAVFFFVKLYTAAFRREKKKDPTERDW